LVTTQLTTLGAQQERQHTEVLAVGDDSRRRHESQADKLDKLEERLRSLEVAGTALILEQVEIRMDRIEHEITKTQKMVRTERERSQ